MPLSDLAPGELRRRLGGPGLDLRTGPFSVRIHSRIGSVAEGIERLYARHPLAEGDFRDFHVALTRPAGLRRWYRPQVRFEFDGSAPFKPLPLDQAFAMFEWGLNWCVANHAHSWLVLHAAVVARGDRAAILPGRPGAGKSTLCAGLASRGWRLLSDELALIDPQTGLLHGLARPVGLKNESIEVIRGFAPDAVLGPPARDTSKGTVAHMAPTPQSVDAMRVPARAAWVVMPRFAAGAAPELGPLSRADAFMELADNAFNYSVHGARGFEVLAGVIDACACFRFRYGSLADAVGIFDRLAGEGA